MLFRKIFFLLLFLLTPHNVFASNEVITIGSKKFTENYILGEIMAQYLESKNFTVHRKFGLGGTMVAYQALKSNEINVYAEYTGTLTEAVFKKKNQSIKQLDSLLDDDGIQMLQPFGFNNTYCLIVAKELATKLNLKDISDLSQHPKLKGGLSGEFQNRADGWIELKKIYQLKSSIVSIEIPLTYEALKNNNVDFAEAYSTEPLILKYGFTVLEDNKNFFPRYEAVPIVNKNLSQKAINALNSLHSILNNSEMTRLNSKAIEGASFKKIASDFLISKQLISSSNLQKKEAFMDWAKLYERTKDHLFLTMLAVLLATLIAVPLASFISNKPSLAQPVLTFSGMLQTIPSIALLSLMIPFVGIGFKPALLGLFIYSLLPIIRNTYTAMRSIDPRLIVAARGIGLYPWEIFYSVKLPLSFPMILAGVRTATILNIGTATLAAFIGAGGLGEPIVTGLALNDTRIILEGAIPAALLAIVIDFLFGLVNKAFNKSL